jgi:hypothetical protein
MRRAFTYWHSPALGAGPLAGARVKCGSLYAAKSFCTAQHDRVALPKQGLEFSPFGWRKGMSLILRQ